MVEGFFRTRREAGLTYRSQSVGELDRALDRRRKLQVQLEGTGARGPARGRRREQAKEKLAEIQRLVDAFESGLVFQDQNRRAQARQRRRSSLERLDAARAAMAQRKDVQPEWVITTFGTLVDGLKAATTSPDTSPIPPRSASSDPGPQVNIGILQRLGFVQTGKMLGDQLGWSEAWVPEPGRRLFFIIDLRDRRRPCAVLLVCDPGRQAHQLFALKRIVRAPFSSTQRASFSVRRDPSTYSPAAFTERWNDVPRGTMGARSHASTLAGAVCFRPPMKQASRSKEESFGISFEVMLVLQVFRPTRLPRFALSSIR